MIGQEKAKKNCPVCEGTGDSGDGLTVCDCALKAVFDTCLDTYEHIQPYSSGVARKGSHLSRPNEEFRADFELLAKRALKSQPVLLETFLLYHVACVETLQCCAELGVNQGTLYQRICRIKVECGRAFIGGGEDGIYPVCNYFGDPPQKPIYLGPAFNEPQETTNQEKRNDE